MDGWFANRGQILQLLVACIACLFGGIKAWPEMKQNEFLSAGALLFYALVALVLISLGISITPTDPIKTTAITPQPSFDKRTVLPDGRVIISSSSEDLQAAHHNKTIDQFNRLLDGKWIKISGKIEENHGNGLVFLKTQEYPMIVLQFGKGWDEQLSILPRGSSVTIRGKMGSASLAAIHLEECELL